MRVFAHLRPLAVSLAETAFRFPVSLACGFLYCGITIVHTRRWWSDTVDGDLVDRLQVFAVVGFFLALAVRLIAESRDWGRVREIMLTAVGLALLAVKIFVDQPPFDAQSETVLFLGPGMVLLVMAAPYLSQASDPNAFWEFNRASWLGAALAFLAALILALGLMFALWAIEELFAVRLPSRLEEDVWTVCLSVFWPWLALSRVPRIFESTDGARCPKPLAVLIAFVLVPLAIAYFVILYAYIVRILVLWELPRGKVSAFVCGYAAFGTAVWLIAWPLRETGPIHVRLFQRYFHYALILPTILLVVAVAERMLAYGITEPRYTLAVASVWLAAMVTAFAWRRTTQLVLVPAVLAALLIATSFGPWGAASVSIRSQTDRLQAALADAGLFSEGRMVPTEATDLPLLNRQDVVSILRFLEDRRQLQVVVDWFDRSAPQPAADREEILALIAPNFEWQRRNTGRVFYAVSPPIPLDAIDYLVPTFTLDPVHRSDGSFASPDGPTIDWTYDSVDEVLKLRIDEVHRASFDIRELVDSVRDRYGADWEESVSSSDMMIDKRAGPYLARLIIVKLSGSIRDFGPSFWGVEVILALRRVEPSAAAPDPENRGNGRDER